MFIISIIFYALQIYSFILIARVIMTWIPNLDYNNPIAQFLFQATEPVLKPIRDNLPSNTGFDFSPLVVFIAIAVLQRVLLSIF